MADTLHSLLSFENQTILDSPFIAPGPQTFLMKMIPKLDLATVLNHMAHIFTFAIIWKLLVVILILGNLKTLPLMWHVSVPVNSNIVKSLTSTTDAIC